MLGHSKPSYLITGDTRVKSKLLVQYIGGSGPLVIKYKDIYKEYSLS